MNDEHLKLISNIFFPHIEKERERLDGQNIHFAHYTDATAALSIIRNKQMWMRKASLMNDVSEIKHGETRTKQFFFDASNDQLTHEFWPIISAIAAEKTETPIASSKFMRDLYNRYFVNLADNTYLTCVSEHDINDDHHGRLSMWRGYSSRAGVALVFKSDPILQHSQLYQTNTYPSLYLSNDEIDHSFKTVVGNAIENHEFLRKIGYGATLNNLMLSFLSLSLCLKHQAFYDEREWRVALCPTIFTPQDLKPETEVISGVPQPVYKLPLESQPDQDYEAGIGDLIERVIIGPTDKPSDLVDMFVKELEEAGAKNPTGKVYSSDIPVRL